MNDVAVQNAELIANLFCDGVLASPDSLKDSPPAALETRRHGAGKNAEPPSPERYGEPRTRECRHPADAVCRHSLAGLHGEEAEWESVLLRGTA